MILGWFAAAKSTSPWRSGMMAFFAPCSMRSGASTLPIFDNESYLSRTKWLAQVHSSIVKPPGAEVDLLGPGLERIAGPAAATRPLKAPSWSARAVVIRHLLREEAADARGKAD